MSDTPEQEPSIEEILSSIRQIISDDDEDDAVDEAPVAPEPEPEPEEEDVLDLTEVVGEPASEEEASPQEEQEDMDIAWEEPEEAAHKPESEPEPVRESPPVAERPVQDKDSIMTDQAASATLEGFSSLLGNLAVERGSHPSGITLEDIVRELMRPMLRDWLDQNLPPLIEKLVREELERLAHKAMNK